MCRRVMLNSPNPFVLLTAEHLIYWFLKKFIIILNKEKYRKKRSSLKYDVKTNSGPFFQSKKLFPHSQ